MTRLTILGSGVFLAAAAWFGAGNDVPNPTLSPEMIERCMVVALEVDPDLAGRLQRIRRERTEQDFRRAMGNARHLVGLASLKQQNPQLYDVKIKDLKLQAQIDHLLEQLIAARRGDGVSPAVIQEQLERLVTHQVGYSLIARGFYLIRLEDHVKSLRDELDHDMQPANHRLAVKRRYQELLDRVDAALAAE